MNTPAIISLRKRFSNFICMKKVITRVTLMVAIISAAATEKAPRWIDVTETEIKVRISNPTRTEASDVYEEI
jgi:hypothetical protein